MQGRAVGRTQQRWTTSPPFEAIEQQFGLQEKQVIALMRLQMKASSFKMWRERVSGRKTKHIKQRDFVSGRFRSLASEGFLMGSDKGFGYWSDGALSSKTVYALPATGADTLPGKI
jgi:uncharacterized protein (TIGR03643 family)